LSALRASSSTVVGLAHRGRELGLAEAARRAHVLNLVGDLEEPAVVDLRIADRRRR
jgi:hypothetical protein